MSPPRGFREAPAAIHAPDCPPRPRVHTWPEDDACGGTYECPRCEREFGWCIGAYDDTPALCDECAHEIQDGWGEAADLDASGSSS